MANKRNVIILVSALLIITLICCAAGGVYVVSNSNLANQLAGRGGTPTGSQPSPTPTATFFTRTPSATPTITSTPGVPPNMCDWAVVEGEEFRPNYTLFPPGAPFQKGWRVRNAGTCTWTKDYKVVFYSGRVMDAPLTYMLPQEVKPGQSISIIFDAVAPLANGRHYGFWKMRNARNLSLGIGSERNGSLVIDINVGGPSLTPDLTRTAAPRPTQPDPDMQPNKCDAVKVVEESIIPNNTVFVNATFTKLWRLKNIGGCTWSTGYAVVFESGTQMDAPASQGLPNPVEPGQTVDVYVKMKAPNKAGTYTGNWKMRSDVATTFGAGPLGADPLTVTITVNAVTVLPATQTAASAKTGTAAVRTNTPVRTITRTPTITQTPTATPLPANQWRLFSRPTGNTLYDVNLVTPYDGWAVGAGGTTIRWNGTDWSVVPSGISEDLNAVSAVSSTDIFAVGAGGTILHWDGFDWNDVGNPFSGQSGCNLVQVRMLDASHGWIAGENCGGASASILRWDGSSWSNAGYPYPADSLMDIYAVNDNDVWAYGATATRHWDGSSWTTFVPGVSGAVGMYGGSYGFGRGGPDGVGTYGIMQWNGSAWSSVGSTTAWWRDVDLVGSSFGQAVGSMVSAWTCGINGWNGVSWLPMACPTSYVLHGVDMVSGADGWAVGEGGVILRYGNITTPQATGTPVPAPTLTGIAPDHGLSAGGQTVVLTGTFLSGSGFTTTSVTFGGTPATSFTVDNANQITAVTPPHAGGLVTVQITTPGGNASLVNGFEYYPQPTITNVNPDAGPEAGGQTVTINGTGFEGPGFTTTSVTFGGTPAASFTVDNANRITAVTPPGSGQVNVVVVTPGGTATRTNGYAYAPVPTISSISPDEGNESGGTEVIITGTGFSGAGYTTTSVTFGGIAATSFVVDTPSQITAFTPPHLPGQVNVAVGTPGGTATRTNGYLFLPGPTILSVSPEAGALGGGTSVVITGSGYQDYGISVDAVEFGGVPATSYTVDSDTQITAIAPAGTGRVDIYVETSVNGVTLPGGFEYIPAPVFTSVAPDHGPSAGGQSITITGTGFDSWNYWIPSVTIGGAPAAITWRSATQLTVTTPPGAAGTVDIIITTPGGSVTATGAFTYDP